MKQTPLLALLIVCSTLSSLYSRNVFAEGITFKTYTVQKGDTCTSIAKKFYGDPHAYDHIHEYNDLSSANYACEPGQVLKIPIYPEKPEAELTSRYGRVRAKSPNVDWKNVDVGAQFYPAWKVNTGAESSAELGFRNETTLQMKENTLVVIYGPDKKTTAVSNIGRATVDRGRLKTFLGDLNGEEMTINTPSAMAKLNGGNQQVTVDENEESRFANHKGSDIEVMTPEGKGKVFVKKGYGSRVRKNQPPEKPRKLPLTPQWKPGLPQSALVINDSKATLNAEWMPVKGAVAYRVELSHDERQLNLIFSKNVPANITRIELRELSPGKYYLSVVSIDEQKFESIPSNILRIHVLNAKSPRNQTITGDKEISILLGSKITPPKGAKCSLSKQADQLVLQKMDQDTLYCDYQGLKLSAKLNIVKPKAFIEEKKPIEISPNGTTTAVLHFDPLVPARFDMSPPENVSVRSLKTSRTELQIAVTGENAHSGIYTVPVKTFDNKIGSFKLKISSDIPKVVAKARYPIFYFTALVGYNFMLDSDKSLYPGGSGEIGLGVIANDYFAGELRAGYGYYTLPKRSHDATQSISARTQVMVGWMAAPVAAYVSLGGIWKALFSQSGTKEQVYGTVGVGATPYLTEKIALRVETDIAIGPKGEKKDGVEILPEIRGGVEINF